jgi:hypothetical protein
VNQFGQAYGAERRVLVAGGAEDSPDQLFDRFPATFRSDNNAGIED